MGFSGHDCRMKNLAMDKTYFDDAITYETDDAHHCSKCTKSAPCSHMQNSCYSGVCPGEECPSFCEGVARDLWIAFSEGACNNFCGNELNIKFHTGKDLVKQMGGKVLSSCLCKRMCEGEMYTDYIHKKKTCQCFSADEPDITFSIKKRGGVYRTSVA